MTIGSRKATLALLSSWVHLCCESTFLGHRRRKPIKGVELCFYSQETMAKSVSCDLKSFPCLDFHVCVTPCLSYVVELKLFSVAGLSQCQASYSCKCNSGYLLSLPLQMQQWYLWRYACWLKIEKKRCALPHGTNATFFWFSVLAFNLVHSFIRLKTIMAETKQTIWCLFLSLYSSEREKSYSFLPPSLAAFPSSPSMAEGPQVVFVSCGEAAGMKESFPTRVLGVKYFLPAKCRERKRRTWK